MNGSEPVRREYPPIPIVSAHALIFREGRVLLVERARWAAREELDALDMHPLVRETVRRAFEGADGGVSE